jgi:hypothetical protein
LDGLPFGLAARALLASPVLLIAMALDAAWLEVALALVVALSVVRQVVRSWRVVREASLRLDEAGLECRWHHEATAQPWAELVSASSPASRLLRDFPGTRTVVVTSNTGSTVEYRGVLPPDVERLVSAITTRATATLVPRASLLTQAELDHELRTSPWVPCEASTDGMSRTFAAFLTALSLAAALPGGALVLVGLYTLGGAVAATCSLSVPFVAAPSTVDALSTLAAVLMLALGALMLFAAAGAVTDLVAKPRIYRGRIDLRRRGRAARTMPHLLGSAGREWSVSSGTYAACAMGDVVLVKFRPGSGSVLELYRLDEGR